MTAAPAITPCRGHTGRPKRGYRWGRRLDRARRITAQECGLPARPYRCPDCGWYHLSTLEEWGR